MARAFDGASGRIAYTAGATQKSLTQISIHWRGYRSGPGELGYGVIGMHGTSDAARKYMINNDNGDGGLGFVFQAYFSTSQGRWIIGYPTNSIWYDFLITYDASATTNNPIWYKNGVSQSVTTNLTPSGTVVTTDTNIYIGNTGDDSLTWNGLIAEYAVWNRILTQAEATKLANNYSPLFIPSGLVFYDRLAGYSASEVEELTSSVGTLTGTAYATHPSIIYPSNGFFEFIGPQPQQ